MPERFISCSRADPVDGCDRAPTEESDTAITPKVTIRMKSFLNLVGSFLLDSQWCFVRVASSELTLQLAGRRQLED